MTGSFDPWRSGDRKRRRSPGGFTVSGGALSFTHLTGGSDTTTEPSTTASITPSANTPVFCSVVIAVEGGGNTGDSDSMSVSGCNLTWTQVGRAHYQGSSNDRRSVYVFRGFGASPTTGSLTIDFTTGLGATWTEHMWSVDECANATTTLPTPYITEPSGAQTSATVTVSETPDTGDFVFAAFGVETASATISLNSELETSLYNQENGTDGRSIQVAYDSAPDASPAPGISWTGGAGSCSGVAFVVNTA